MAGEAIDIGTIYANLDIKSGDMVKGLAQGERAVKLIAVELRNLDEQLKHGAIDMGTYLSRVAQLDMAAAGIDGKMRAANAAINAQASAIDVLNGKLSNMQRASGGAYQGTSQLGMGLMQLGYVVDDLQYGFSAVVNNVAPMAFSFAKAAGMATTSAAGLAAGLQLTTVAVSLLYNHWDDLLRALGSGKIRTEAEEMAELAKQTKLTADEAERLARFKAVESKQKEFAEAKTEAQKKSEEVSTKAVIEAGIENVRAGILQTKPEMLDMDTEVQKAKKALEGVQSEEHYQSRQEKLPVGVDVDAFVQNEILDAKKALREERIRAANRQITISNLPKFFPGGAEQLGGLVRQNPQAFGPHANALLSGLKEATRAEDQSPESRQRQKVAKGVEKIWDGFKKAIDAEVEKQAGKDRKVDEKALAHRIRKAMPDIEHQADVLATAEDEGKSDRAASLIQLRDSMTAKGIKRGDAEAVAKKAMDKADEEDPEVRRKRLEAEARAPGAALKREEREALAMANELNPRGDLKNRASRFAQDVHFGKKSAEDARQALASELIESGMPREQAMTAAGPLMAEAGKENPEARKRRLSREALRKADEVVPDLADAVESAVARGADAGKVREGLIKRFKKGDMGDDEAANAADQALERGNESVRERMANMRHGRPGGDDASQEPSRSEVFASSQLTAKVQAGVGTDNLQKKQADNSDKTVELLTKIANKSVVQIEVA